MMKMIGFAVAATMVVGSAVAQKPETVAVKGKVTSVEGSTVAIDQVKGGAVKVTLAPKVVVMTVGTATLKDIAVGSFVGVGAMPQADGTQKAIRVMIFPEVQRGTGEGHYPWKAPAAKAGSTMTNATVDTTVSGVDGQVLTVKYKGGTQKIVIGPDAQIVSNIPGTAADLKPGVNVAIPAAEKAADGSLTTARVNVGRGTFVP